MAMYYLLKKILVGLAWLQIRRYKPVIIGVTGNVGKTSTKEAISAVLRSGKTVRVAAGNLNNEFGFALTILGNWDYEYYERGSSVWLWLRVLLSGLKGLIVRRNFAGILLLEYGADRPGDISRLVKLFKPHIAVVTAVGDIPVHIEFFSAKGGSAFGGKNGVDALTDEKANLVKFLTKTDYAILNNDDSRVLNMKSGTRASVLTYGFSENSVVRVSDFDYEYANTIKPTGVSFNLNKDSDFVKVNIYGSLGKSQAYAAAAAAAVGIILGMDLSQISGALRRYTGSKGRLKIISGINDSTIIDDTYNSSPASAKLALETLGNIKGSRKIAVLGDMLELGEHTITSHKDIGLITDSFANILVCVGQLAKLIAESSKITKDKIFTFNTSDEAKSKIRDLIRSGDIILAKGSQGMRMEKIVVEIMAEPRRSKELLVRQSRNWLSKF